MTRSMTGFGKGESQDSRRAYTVQLKSVNNRFLELGLKLPTEFWAHEAEARTLLQASLNRGKVDIHWNESARAGAAAAPGPRVDTARALAWKDALGSLAEDLGLSGSLGMEAVIRLPGVLSTGDGVPVEDDDAETRWKGMRSALEDALTALNESREREGAALAEELRLLLKGAEDCVDGIEKRSLELQQGFAERLRRRLAQILETLGPDDPRIAMEAALAADRADIREELVRFRAHTAEFRRLLGSQESAGKRMDFLCQELLREANTMGSKSPEAGLTQAVVGLKSVVERLKEQVQNVE
ncbi:MAG TPA: YicC/YloC family endoribonuclease [bacterium]|jgi:uncharacterized protein (TIGR00255 family)|nr:YicC/YloC family endoribonuclease [bacterium]